MNPGTSLRGFLIQSRRADLGEDNNVRIGSFTEVRGTQHVCERVTTVGLVYLICVALGRGGRN